MAMGDCSPYKLLSFVCSRTMARVPRSAMMSKGKANSNKVHNFDRHCTMRSLSSSSRSCLPTIVIALCYPESRNCMIVGRGTHSRLYL